MKNEFILASASPRRKELFRLLDIPYRIQAAEGEEKVNFTQPWDVVQWLAAQKAAEVGRKNPHCWTIGADTVVSCGQNILGKPKDEQDAFDMLKMLQNGIHQVYTGVSLFRLREDKTTEQYTFFEKTDVEVCPMTEEEIWQYIRTGEPMDKAGAYGIQGAFCRYVKGIRGDYQNVVGLPVSRLYHEMAALGLV